MNKEPQPQHDSYQEPPPVVPQQEPVKGKLHPAIILVPGVVALLIAVGVFFLLMSGRNNAGTSPTTNLKTEPKVGSLAPDFELKDLKTGATVKLSSLRGRPVWINFWATWCPPCREEMPDMERIYGEYKGKNLAILGVDVQEDAQKVNEFTGSLELTWTFMLDEKGEITNRYFVGGLPSHYFVDREGVIQAIHVGGFTSMSGTRTVDPREYLAKIVAP